MSGRRVWLVSQWGIMNPFHKSLCDYVLRVVMPSLELNCFP